METASASSTLLARDRTAQTGKFLTFSLSNESYGVDVLKVREIIRYLKITPVPQMPAFVKGVINLRGKVLPVIDLRLKFGLEAAEPSERTCIVVVRLRTEAGQDLLLGMIVDSVEEVINIADSDIEETPEFGTRVDTAYLKGMAKVKGVIKTLLDIDRVVSADTLRSF
jgi:purine-binding chemotaxis protein CheW